jgi:hypothetical protein
VAVPERAAHERRGAHVGLAGDGSPGGHGGLHHGRPFPGAGGPGRCKSGQVLAAVPAILRGSGKMKAGIGSPSTSTPPESISTRPPTRPSMSLVAISAPCQPPTEESATPRFPVPPGAAGQGKTRRGRRGSDAFLGLRPVPPGVGTRTRRDSARHYRSEGGRCAIGCSRHKRRPGTSSVVGTVILATRLDGAKSIVVDVSRLISPATSTGRTGRP